MKYSEKNQLPVVVLDITHSNHLLPYLVTEARHENWRFFDISLTKNVIPSDFQVIGAITSSLPDVDLCQRLREKHIPVIRTGLFDHPDDDIQPAVMPDMRAIGAMAAEHFAEREFKHVCYFGHTPWSTPPHLFEGLNAAAENLGCDVHLRKFPEYISPPGMPRDKIQEIRNKNRDQQMKAWLQDLPKPIGILAYSYRLAARLDMICKSLEIAVPGEVSIVCAMDEPYCELGHTPISGIDIDSPAIAKHAINMLKQLMDGKRLPFYRKAVLPRAVILRQSSDTLAVDDPHVAKALSFIIRYLEWPITVEDIAEDAGTPRRRLASLFKRFLGLNVNQYIRQKRLERACELLTTTEFPLAKITTAIGFCSKPYFHKVFLETYGVTPQDYRDGHPSRHP